MDSPQLLHLALLLLALAAPRPNIAMIIVGTAEGIGAKVTVYLCKDCKSCACRVEEVDSEKSEKLTDTQNKTCSYGIRDLVTNETHISICFGARDFCLKGICSIYWQRDGRSGLACGNLSSGENGRGGISTEQNTICCAAEIDTKKYNPELKCFYTEMSHPKLNRPPDAIRGEGIPGNPEFLTSKKNNIGILFAFLFVGVCTGWGTMYYCLRRWRRGQAFRHCRQDSEGDVVPLHRDSSTREETPLPAASSSSLRMHSNQLNTD